MSARTSALDGIHGKLGLWRKTGVKQTRTALEGHTAPWAAATSHGYEFPIF